MELAELKIEYKQDGNVVQIYNSLNVCSLMINGVVVDMYKGVIASRFVLKGSIEKDGNVIPVEAKMGFVNMRLFYNGVLVAKKFMGLG